MTEQLEPFTPTDVLGKIRDPLSGELSAPRRTTSEEQETEAVAHALTLMLERRIWKVALPVLWTRRAPSTLTIVGHHEHVGAVRVPVLDAISDETDADGAPIDRSEPARYARLVDELVENDSTPDQGL